MTFNPFGWQAILDTTLNTQLKLYGSDSVKNVQICITGCFTLKSNHVSYCV